MNRLANQLSTLPAPAIIMGVGIPGSGKTTTLREVSEQLDIARICPDDIREELTGSQADQSVNSEVWEETYRRAQIEVGLGRSAIIDATHAEAFRRPMTIEMYRKFGARTIAAVVFNTSLKLSKERNKRPERGREVPERVLERMYRNLANQPVRLREGFDQIITVQQDDSFTVQP